MKNAFLRQGEEIIWEAKPEYTMSLFSASLLRASLIPMFFIVLATVIIVIGIRINAADNSLFVMLSCIFILALPWIGWNLLKVYLDIRGIRYLLSNQRLFVLRAKPKLSLKLEWSEVEAAEDSLRSDGLHQVQINQMMFYNLRDTQSLISLIRQYAPHTFIQQTSISDSLENQLRADEDILWQGSAATTAAHWRELITPGGIIIVFLLASMGILARDNTVALSGWLLFILVPVFLNIVFKKQRISSFYSNKFYIISNRRLIIADRQQNKIVLWSPMKAITSFGEILDIHKLYTLDFGHGFAFSRLSPEQVKEITRVLAPYLTKSEKDKHVL